MTSAKTVAVSGNFLYEHHLQLGYELCDTGPGHVHVLLLGLKKLSNAGLDRSVSKQQSLKILLSGATEHLRK